MTLGILSNDSGQTYDFNQTVSTPGRRSVETCAPDRRDRDSPCMNDGLLGHE